MENNEPRSLLGKPHSKWMLIVGSGIGILGLLFLMLLYFLDRKAPPPDDDALHVTLILIFSLTAALSAGIMTGYAAVSGSMGFLGQKNPLNLSLGGGVAVLFTSMALLFLWYPLSHAAVPRVSPHTEILQSAQKIGLTALHYGKYESSEDDRLEALIRGAQSIKILVYNGNGIFGDKFAGAFRAFLNRQDFNTELSVLFADPGNQYYEQNLAMTARRSLPANAYPDNKRVVAYNVNRLVDWSGGSDRLHIRYFDTQLRVPIIVIDNRYCILTLRLPPDEGAQSIRFEMQRDEQHPGEMGYVTSCADHFDKLWSQAHDSRHD